MNKRYLGAVIVAPILIFLFLGGPYLKYCLMILSLCGLYEFYGVCKKINIKPISIVSYVLCILYYFQLHESINYKLLVLSLILVIFLLLCLPVLMPDTYDFLSTAVTILGFFYVAVFFSFIVLINEKTHGNYLVWIVFIASWLCDTSAYYSGRYLGKNKNHMLCPKVSPNKTLEGSIGGLLGATLSCGVFGIIINNLGVNIAIYHFFIIGALCGVFSQFGDLVASSIKRHCNVKDYSNLIPGHGGILDRFDSILYAAVVVYYYITFIVGM